MIVYKWQYRSMSRRDDMNATNSTKDMKKGVIEKWRKNQM